MNATAQVLPEGFLRFLAHYKEIDISKQGRVSDALLTSPTGWAGEITISLTPVQLFPTDYIANLFIDCEPITQPPNKDQTRFERLSETWKRETGMFSVVQQKMIHPIYLEIIGMSWSAVPFLIQDMQKGAAHWFPALRAIAGDTKPDDSDAGSFKEAVSIWSDWWRRKQYGAMDTVFERVAIS